MTAVQRIRQCVTAQDGQLVGRIENVELRSVFQPIYSLGQGRMVGVEGLVRCSGSRGEYISPLQLFGCCGRSEEQNIQLDRLCRYLHLGNHRLQAPAAHWLFLNVSAHTVVSGRCYGSYFGDLLREMNFPPQRVVVEILEDSIHDEALLGAAVEYYRELGCTIAIDDFGAGNSNINRVWKVGPDIVKLDRSLLLGATQNIRNRHALPKLVDLLHESGCQVVVEGIETEAEAMVAKQCGADMVQGYYFACPSPVVPAEQALACMEHIGSLNSIGLRACC